MSERLLLLETSGRRGLVAVAEGDVVRAERRLDEARRHARDLAPAVADLLAGQGWTPRDVTAVLVGRGPGSYTGLRVGLMTAMAFAYATRCRLLAADTFAVLAAQATDSDVPLDIVADGQQDKIYRQSFLHGSAVGPLDVEPAGTWLERLTPPVRVGGPGLSVVRGRLPKDVVIEEDLAAPTATGLLRVALPRLREGERDDLFALEPLYARPSSAEEMWRPRVEKSY